MIPGGLGAARITGSILTVHECIHQCSQEQTPLFIAVTELESLLGSQNSLIRKLKKECCMLGSKLEELTETSRSVLGFILLLWGSAVPPSLCTHRKFCLLQHPSCLFHHFMKRHPSKLLGQITSTLHILPPGLTCFLVNLMLQ